MSQLIPSEKHEQVLEEGIDVPEQRPAVPLPLDRVGIAGKTVWVDFTNPEWGRISFTAEIHVNLSAEYRGIHMSRIEQAISELHGQRFEALTDYAFLLARKVIEGQNSRHGAVHLAGRVPILRQTPVSGHPSLDSAGISASVHLERRQNGGRKSVVAMGAEIHHLTACPCTQLYNSCLFESGDPSCPRPTHSQRSRTGLEIKLTDSKTGLTYEDIVNCLTAALHSSRDLLKRPDEAELVLAAHRHPQFAEDAVREVAKEAAARFMPVLPPSARIRIHCLSLESIHIHDVVSSLDLSLQDIVSFLRNNTDSA